MVRKGNVGFSFPEGLVNEVKKHISESNMGYNSPTEFIKAATREKLEREKER